MKPTIEEYSRIQHTIYVLKNAINCNEALKHRTPKDDEDLQWHKLALACMKGRRAFMRVDSTGMARSPRDISCFVHSYGYFPQGELIYEEF